MNVAVISPDRYEALRRLSWRLDNGWGLAAMLGVALLVRLLIAPRVGFHGDLNLSSRWAQRLADVGPGDFYVQGRFADYPPGYLYVLWLTGKLVSTPGYLAVKVPTLVGDLVLAWIVGVFFLGRLVSAASSLAERRVPRYAVAAAAAVPLALGVGLLAPAWNERLGYDRWGGVLIRSEQEDEREVGPDIAALANIVKASGDGRVYAGTRANWGKDFKVGHLPVFTWLANNDVDAIGFTFRTIASLSNDVEASFDETNPGAVPDVQHPLSGPSARPAAAGAGGPDGPARELPALPGSDERLLQVVDRAAPIIADRSDLDAATDAFRSSDFAAKGVYPSVNFAGDGAPAPTEGARGAAGNVLAQSEALQDGDFRATVLARRRAVVLLKATYDPRWSVTVDGVPAEATMMAPSLVGVEVPPGRHGVHFRYKPFPWYPLLIGLGGLALLALALTPYREEVLRLVRGRRTARTAGERAATGARSSERS